MKGRDLKKPSESNWAKVEAMADEDIDTSDIPPLDDSFFANARLRLPAGKVPVLLSVDSDLFEWFKAQGDEYQSLINVALRSYAESRQRLER
jgi:uncharacterized protein (DUF4415 family)